MRIRTGTWRTLSRATKLRLLRAYATNNAKGVR